MGATFVCTFLTACSIVFPTSRPTQLPRDHVGLTMKDGVRAIVKNGELETVGMGGSLVAAVADDPEASRVARRFRRNRIWANVVGGLAMLCTAGGAYWYTERDEGDRTGPYLVLGACANVLLWTVIVDHTNDVNLYDAINLYNSRDAAR